MKQNMKIALLVLVLGFGSWYAYNLTNDSEGYKNTTYSIGGRVVTLVNGVSGSAKALASAGTAVTEYMGGDLKADFNSDGLEDVALFLNEEKDPEHKHTFYYIAVAINTGSGYTGTNAVILGENIRGQKLQYIDGDIVVTYLSHAYNQESDEKAAVKIKKYLKLSDSKLIESRLPDVGEFLIQNELILVTDPAPKSVIVNPVTVKGVVGGDWYANNSFPVILYDEDGKQIAASAARVTNIAATKDYSIFTVTLNFVKPEDKVGKKGLIVFRRSNNIGAPDGDSIEIPVEF